MSAPEEQRHRLRQVAREANTTLDGADAATIVRWAVEEFGDTVCVASSMVDAALSHLAAQAKPSIDVLFLDTGYHFAETIGVRDAVAAGLPVRVRNVQPRLSVAEQDAKYGPRLHEREPDRCCAMRKVAPLERALAPYSAWITGLRREEAATRHDAGVVEWDERFELVKINPLAAWSFDDLQAYIVENNLVVNPMVFDGYPSIGCAPCTRRVAPGEDPRSGRWAGQSKTECGLHNAPPRAS